MTHMVFTSTITGQVDKIELSNIENAIHVRAGDVMNKLELIYTYTDKDEILLKLNLTHGIPAYYDKGWVITYE